MLPHKRRLKNGFVRLRPVKVTKEHLAFASRDSMLIVGTARANAILQLLVTVGTLSLHL